MRTMSDRGGNIESSDRRIRPSRKVCAGKNNREGGGMVERRGKEEEKKNNTSVEWNINST